MTNADKEHGGVRWVSFPITNKSRPENNREREVGRDPQKIGGSTFGLGLICLADCCALGFLARDVRASCWRWQTRQTRGEGRGLEGTGATPACRRPCMQDDATCSCSNAQLDSTNTSPPPPSPSLVRVRCRVLRWVSAFGQVRWSCAVLCCESERDVCEQPISTSSLHHHCCHLTYSA